MTKDSIAGGVHFGIVGQDLREGIKSLGLHKFTVCTRVSLDNEHSGGIAVGCCFYLHLLFDFVVSTC